eukprot:c1202_g1_i1 orf=37-2163(-)
MNSLANLNAVVDEQGDSSTWPSDQGWDHPVATICTGSLTDNRLNFHHPTAPRQEWDWSDSNMILASQYGPDEHEIDCKPGILQLEALGGAGAGGSGAGLRQYSAGILSAASMSPSIGGSAAQGSWPGLLLNAVPIRQHMGLDSSSASCYSSSSLLYGGGVGLGGGGASGLSSYYPHHSHQLADMEQRRLNDILGRGNMYSVGGGGGSTDFMSDRIGLNLGGRTYFSAEDMSTTLAARYHVAGKRFRPNSPSMHVPLCQAEGCKADLSIAKHYHRRHKVCEYHSKAATVTINGNTQRFCQQCSRFHALSQFDEGKRSCRQRLADHNRRRRKPQPTTALPAAPTSGTHEATGAASTDHNPVENQNEDQDTKAGAGANASTSQSDEQGGKQVLKEGTPAKTASTSSAEQTPSLLSPMTLAPSVSLSLQNGSREMQGNHSSNMQVSSEDNNNISEKEAAYESQAAAQYLLNGPSLSLSSNIAAGGAGVGGDSVPTSDHQSPTHAQHGFNEIELSVPWLRAHHVGSSARMGLMQEGLGTLSTASHQAEERSMAYNTARSKRHVNGQYMNEHGRLLAEHMQNLRSQQAAAAQENYNNASKTENWMLESAVAQEGQIVLSLLETATNGSGGKDNHSYNHQRAHEQAHHENAGARHIPLGFLQHPHSGLHLNSGSPTDHLDHEASDAALSLHCMQVLRPLNESLYTTADFMKDGFV